jgi:predicted lipid-binding transport protein (Tim44 family)
MDRMEILFFAVVAAVVLARLYMVLGQNRGAEAPPLEQPVRPSAPDMRRPLDRPDSQPAAANDADASAQTAVRVSRWGVAADGLEAIHQRDRSFDPDAFLEGAKGAFGMIVTAFGRNDLEGLRPLLNDETFAVYESAVAERKASGAGVIEVVRISEARIVAAELVGNRAEIDVHFSSDLADGGDGLRPTDEVWSFERDVTSRSPAWLLCAVQTA